MKESLENCLMKLQKSIAEKEFQSSEIERLFQPQAFQDTNMVIDRFGKIIVATLYQHIQEQIGHDIKHILEDFCLKFNFQFVLKLRLNSELNTYTVYKSVNIAQSTVCSEENMNFEVRTQEAHDFGLYPDAFLARKWLKENSQNKKVLNLFSYTCAFGVAAALGGASDVWNIDPNKDYLSWGKKNAELNKVNFRVVPETAQNYLARKVRQLESKTHSTAHSSTNHKSSNSTKGNSPFDIIVLDPPAFGVGRNEERTLRTQWPKMLESMKLLMPNACIILCNDKWLREEEKVEKLIEKHLSPKSLTVLQKFTYLPESYNSSAIYVAEL